MRTSSHDLGDPIVRVRPAWRPGQVAPAQLVLTDHRLRPATSQVERWAEDLSAAGYSHVRTGAIEPEAARGFLAAGFVVAQRLALLRIDAPFDVPNATRPLRPMRAVDLDLAAAIDLAAFGPTWCFDAPTIGEARHATPAHRARFVVDESGAAIGYAITGRAARNGFLQRVAVAADAQGSGRGAALVADSLRWLRRWRVRTAFVNTEVDNQPALRLYERAGFCPMRSELLVLERAL